MIKIASHKHPIEQIHEEVTNATNYHNSYTGANR
jgi:hypothetical protein